MAYLRIDYTFSVKVAFKVFEQAGAVGRLLFAKRYK